MEWQAGRSAEAEGPGEEGETGGACAGRRPRSAVARVLDGLLWALLLGVLLWRFGPQVGAAIGLTVADGGPAPALELRTLDGEPLALESLRGKVVLVNFWATWCPPCRLEMPGMQRVWESRRDDGFVVLALSRDHGGAAPVRAWLQERGIDFPAAMAHDGVARDFGGVRALPTSFLVDRQGRIRHRVEGFFAEPALRAAVDRLLAEPVPAGVR